MTNIQSMTGQAPADPTEELATISRGRGQRPKPAWRLMLPTRTPWLITGLVLIGSIIVFGAIGPLLVGDPAAISNVGLSGPSAEHWLGTTQTGQDVLAQLAHATRGSLQIGFLVGVLATVLSAFFGIYGAYIGGFADEVFSLLSNVFLVIPGLPLVIVISGFVPRESRGLWTIAVVLALTSWAASARVLRAQTLSVRNRDYVAASRVSGERAWRVIAVEILPNLLPVLASQFVFAVIAAILGEAGLSFLGLGASSSSTLGTMLFYAQNGFALPLGAWWWFLPPGLMIALFGMGLSLINFSIDEIINPKLKNARLVRKRARQTARIQKKAVTS
ncbi:peptide/nickel transport system permease protein [Paenarthrobacter nicotinovorans]|uniref:ABC transporter permease n=1 Tax=Micrococcaceae TaxID=1268 RepID=UPI000876680C|nr:MULTISPECIES: ABC transporter permease [Micrococcaceae]MDR6436579.1 peptide/nickel transport system permease protein [Paenarthrobacter nicotinovorans]SCZ57255.1 peptide/nickel transport system permease protein [Arthrobacter sp. UNCCL28]